MTELDFHWFVDDLELGEAELELEKLIVVEDMVAVVVYIDVGIVAVFGGTFDNVAVVGFDRVACCYQLSHPQPLVLPKSFQIQERTYFYNSTGRPRLLSLQQHRAQ